MAHLFFPDYQIPTLHSQFPDRDQVPLPRETLSWGLGVVSLLLTQSAPHSSRLSSLELRKRKFRETP